MTRDEQVRKIAMLLCGDTTEKECAECKYNCAFTLYGELLYNAGYRKASEVAREIFGELEAMFSDDGFHYFIAEPVFDDLKKKYTEGEK